VGSRQVVSSVLDSLRFLPIARELRELDEAQHLGPAQLLPWQQQRLFRLLCHARDTTDFYQHIIPDNLTPSLALAVLSSLPVITRQHISRELPRFVSRRFAARKLVLQHTSGSTGVPLSFYRDRASLIRQKAEVAYFGSWVGYQPGMRYLYVGPNRPRIRGWLRNELSLWSTYPDDSWFVKLADTLQTRRVRILVAHPSILIPFAAYLSQHSASPTSTQGLRGVIAISEPLTDSARLRIVEALHCPVLSRYSTRELGTVASECMEKRFHINVGSCYVEYLNPNDDRPNLNGGPSRAVVTALNSYGMPFIRYDTGDVVTPAPAGCRCGRASPLLLRIDGRVIDAVTTPSGQQLEGFDLCSQFEDTPAVGQFQFCQLREGGYRISLVPGPGYGNPTEAEILERFRRILGKTAAICVERVDRIDPLPSGKTPPIYRER